MSSRVGLPPADSVSKRRSKRLKHTASLTTVLALATGSKASVASPPPKSASKPHVDFSAFCCTPPPCSNGKSSGPKKTPTWNVVSPSSTPFQGRTSNKSNEKGVKKRASSSPRKKATTPTTQSFGARWAGSFPALQTENIKVHTLILGTHPSIKSLEENQYYGHSQNAFWWICGDCLGFRRGNGISPSTGKPYAFTSALRHDNVLPYEEQVESLCRNGFALWDLVKSCKREGSLDADIHQEEPNKIQEFCQEHPNIRRIVFANGGGACTIFKKHFKEWLDSGQLVPGANDESQRAFKKWTPDSNRTTCDHNSNQIECISALAVSPAAAKYTYKQKRDFWDKYVYSPGLADHESLKSKE